ncbi:MAG: hypothetical protein H0T66_02865 [Geodermatophilaceae bacterium]|nr:hypothetical protein [Geodermatophilaceae bacterium]MDQ3456842.1 hypothetical protein [Actinomycetota bacterium]
MISAVAGDALDTLWWGVRHFGLLFLGCLVAGVATFPLIVTRGGPAYEASALVVAHPLDMAIAEVPGFARAQFDDGAVAGAIAAQFHNVGAPDEIVPDRVWLTVEPDSIVLRVSGQASSGPVAADLANAAAATLVAELNRAATGGDSFQLQSPALPSATEVRSPVGTAVAVGLGAGAGIALGLALIAVLLLVRRPVLDAADATEITGLPVLGTITLSQLRSGRHPAPPAEIPGMVAVCRRLLTTGPRVVVLTSAGRADARRRQVLVALAALLGQARKPDLTLVEDPGPSAVLDPAVSSTSIVLVPIGVSERALRSAATATTIRSGSRQLLMMRTELVGRQRLRRGRGRR